MKTKKIKIQVLQSDIDHGIQGDTQQCMVARVVKRMIKPKYRSLISVVPEEIEIKPNDNDTENYMSIGLDEDTAQKIRDFDAQDGKDAVKPFSFTVDFPKEMLLCHKKNKLKPKIKS